MGEANDEIVDYVEIVERETGWWWRAMSNNGRKVAVGGEAFFSEQNALRAVQALFPVVSDFRTVLRGMEDNEW
jgi:hypothetical protein